MGFPWLANGIVCCSLLIFLAWFVSKALHRIYFLGKITARDLLHFHHLMISSVMVFSFFGILFPRAEILRPVAKLWAASSAKNMGASSKNIFSQPVWKISAANMVVSLKWSSLFLSLFILLSLAFGLMILVSQFKKLSFLLKNAFLWKKIGSTALYFSDETSIPFSLWLPGMAVVVVPQAVAHESQILRLVCAHEIQHHRQRDTVWLYVLWFLRAVCFWNPFVHLWNKLISDSQEFACDEALVHGTRGKKVSSQAYASCLLWVAETAIHRERHLACATGLHFSADGQILKRRIDKMLSEKPMQFKKSFSFFMAFTILVAFAATAWAAQGFVQDKRVSMAHAQELARRAQRNDGFPIVVNDLVLKELNRYLGTPDGRGTMRAALQQMQNYHVVVDGKLRQYGLPDALAAIPIIESGYQDLPETSNPAWGAGLWMFIRSTAVAYGLHVNGLVDERLNAEMETDAAMRYLIANRARFNDWELSILAYNIGESKVQEAIEKIGSRDAWAIVRSGLDNEPEYLPKVMAAVLIMRNPASLTEN